MAIYHIDPLPLRTRISYAACEAFIPLAIEWMLRAHSHKMTLDEFVGQGLLLVLFLLRFKSEAAYDVEIDEKSIRKLRDGVLEREIPIPEVSSAKEYGWIALRHLRVSGRTFLGISYHSIVIPVTVPQYDVIKAHVLGWIEHPRASASIQLYS